MIRRFLFLLFSQRQISFYYCFLESLYLRVAGGHIQELHKSIDRSELLGEDIGKEVLQLTEVFITANSAEDILCREVSGFLFVVKQSHSYKNPPAVMYGQVVLQE